MTRESLENQIRRIPNCYGIPVVEDWLNDVRPSCPAFVELVSATTSCSPFLSSLSSICRDWLVHIPARDPQEVLDEICTPLDTLDINSAILSLRTRKRQLALLTALADLGGAWSLEQVTGGLTRFADLAVDVMLRALVAASMKRGRIACNSRCDPAFGGIFVLAMGKMGAGELNYSSDIDLIVLFDEECHSPGDFQGARFEFIRITRRLSKLLSEITAQGYVFRTDLRLRPDPLVNPVCMSAGGAARYYESFGRNWERAAFIKARPCAGNIEAGKRFLDEIHPFVWRRNLDFAAVKDANDMRARIQQVKGTGNLGNLSGYSLKLGSGGIREIELFVQTYQMISGGRRRSLRVPQTLGMLPVLAEEGWIDEDTSLYLQGAYRRLRELEHRTQMLRDTQTHEIPRNDAEQERLAALSGHTGTKPFFDEVRTILSRVHEGIEKCLPSRSEQNEVRADVSFLTDSHREMIDRWRHLPAFRTQRATEIFSRLQPMILSCMEQAADPGEALIQFDGFLKGLPAGVQLFSLFESNPLLLQLLADTCATAPRLARYLSRHASVFDAVLDGHFFDSFAGRELMECELKEMISQERDFELVLRSTRRWMHEQQFRLGVHYLRGLVDASQAASVYTDIAESILRSTWPQVTRDFSQRHGKQPGRGAVILAMGSLGAGTLTCQSDLDLLMIYDPVDQSVSEGKKPLPTKLYYSRLTQALVSALSAPMAEGRLYAIDMRLRPSGRQGPVATSIDSFRHYQMNKAWTWEHLALTRARVVAGNPGLAAEVEALRLELLAGITDQETIVRDVSEMRRRLAANTAAAQEGNIWELRSGEGRLLDIELTAQAGALSVGSSRRAVPDQLADAKDNGWLSVDSAEVLRRAYSTLRSILQAVRLTVEGGFSPQSSGTGAMQFLLQQTGQETIDELAAQLHDERESSVAAITSIFGPIEDKR